MFTFSSAANPHTPPPIKESCGYEYVCAIDAVPNAVPIFGTKVRGRNVPQNSPPEMAQGGVRRSREDAAVSGGGDNLRFAGHRVASCFVALGGWDLPIATPSGCWGLPIYFGSAPFQTCLPEDDAPITDPKLLYGTPYGLVVGGAILNDGQHLPTPSSLIGSVVVSPDLHLDDNIPLADTGRLHNSHQSIFVDSVANVWLAHLQNPKLKKYLTYTIFPILSALSFSEVKSGNTGPTVGKD